MPLGLSSDNIAVYVGIGILALWAISALIVGIIYMLSPDGREEVWSIAKWVLGGVAVFVALAAIGTVLFPSSGPPIDKLEAYASKELDAGVTVSDCEGNNPLSDTPQSAAGLHAVDVSARAGPWP